MTGRVLLDGRLATRKPTGIGRYVSGLLLGLGIAAPDLEVHLVRLADQDCAPELLRAAGSSVVHHVVDLPATSPRGTFVLPSMANRLRVDVVHHPHVTPALFGYDCPSVATVHDAKHLGGPRGVSSLGSVRRVVLRSTFRATLQRADAVIAVSGATAADLRPMRPRTRRPVDIVHEAAMPSFAPSTSRAVESLRRSRGWTRPYVLTVGETRPHKNHVGLVEAFTGSSAAETHDLVLVGRPHDGHAELLRAIRASGRRDRIHVVGDLDDEDLPAAYSGAEVFVLPSLLEGFGLPILEAMACATAVITSRDSACAEVAGDAALLVDPLSVVDIGRALDEVLGDPGFRTQLVERGLRRAAAFSWERTAAQTCTVYDAVTHAAH